MITNFSQASLGGHTPESYDWLLEQDTTSQFTYGLMRQNILSLCVNPNYDQMRDSIIFMHETEPCTYEQMNELERRFRPELSSLNFEQQSAVLKCILADNYHMVLGTPGSGKT